MCGGQERRDMYILDRVDRIRVEYRREELIMYTRSRYRPSSRGFKLSINVSVISGR